MKLRRCVKIELWKAFHQRAFRVALFIALAIAAADTAQAFLSVKSLSEGSIIGAGWEGISLFTWWIGINGVTFGHILYFFLWPLLVAIPYASSYCRERKSGLALQIVTRSGRKNYLLSKYIAVFVSSGVVMALPIFMNLMIDAMFCPAALIRVSSSMTTVENGDFMSAVFFTKPWLFALAWCCIHFLWGGATGTICLAFGSAIRKPTLLTLVPFILLVALDLVDLAVRTVLVNSPVRGIINLSPLSLANAASSVAHPSTQVLLGIVMMALLPFVLFYYREKKHDLL